MLCAGEDEVAHAELPDAPQPLHFGPLHQVHDEALRHGDEAVHRVGKELKATVQGRTELLYEGRSETKRFGLTLRWRVADFVIARIA